MGQRIWKSAGLEPTLIKDAGHLGQNDSDGKGNGTKCPFITKCSISDGVLCQFSIKSFSADAKGLCGFMTVEARCAGHGDFLKPTLLNQG